MPSPKNPPSAPEEPRVVVDDRERAGGLHRALEQVIGAPPKIERLPVGDVLVVRRWLVERKTAADLAASIRDGRLASQAEQLLAQRFEPLVIVEGSFEEDQAARAMAPLIRAQLIHLTLELRIPVLRSRSIQDTAQWIRSLLQRVASHGAPPDWRGVNPTGRRVPKAELPPRPVRKALPPDVRARREEAGIVASIPGVGEVRARALIARFGSVAALINASIFDLAETPGIGPRLAETLWRTFHGASAPPR